jgi:hypothetical protein
MIARWSAIRSTTAIAGDPHARPRTAPDASCTISSCAKRKHAASCLPTIDRSAAASAPASVRE